MKKIKQSNGTVVGQGVLSRRVTQKRPSEKAMFGLRSAMERWDQLLGGLGDNHSQQREGQEQSPGGPHKH